ncbi:uncharacterized protein SPPG_08716 [Spizellomyces punctatus DAOM BR117]|uniref:Kynurenine formamidase n=1 Tax=Spizellomyces punctatus (strain DAOM BR117) TaxID=645134 RepID=A0A0L0H4L1_SPIPD|nr:uncharacterized protein SPPG_08716 [Spizellomyces punctatus DAOM BR117]KNC95851.1 hypothetical protein SPPG_08716 [Spizellomyces punctatus DAOM BR117]|eukprot:XP_016603891.1 hypothetical protein SPPG_08716 [Spizellomyces punctatus DAOM BR117]
MPDMHTTVKSFRNLPYTDSDDPKQKLDLFVPVREEPCQEESPIIVYIHGGAWRTGDKSEYEFLGEYFASRDFPTAVLSYRLSTKTPTSVRHPTHVQDCADAIHWLYTQSAAYLGYRPSSIYLIGHSAGGQITGLLTLDPSWLENLGGISLWEAVKGVVGVEGIYDIPKLVEVWPTYVDFIQMAFAEDTDTWRRASPQYYALEDRKLPPYLVVHSPEDELIEVAHSERYFKHLETMGARVLLNTEVRGKHFEMLREKAFFDIVINFINESQLAKGSAVE